MRLDGWTWRIGDRVRTWDGHRGTLLDYSYVDGLLIEWDDRGRQTWTDPKDVRTEKKVA